MGEPIMKSKKSWREKLTDSKGLPKVVEITGKMSKRWGEGTVIIPAPLEVDEIMKKGIFAWIAAHAAEEEATAGRRRITPYWRTVRTGGVLNEKYPGGIEAQREKLESEGHRIIKKGENIW
jgi:hypothetical protein